MEVYEAVPGTVGTLRVPSFTSSQSCDIIVMGVSGFCLPTGRMPRWRSL